METAFVGMLLIYLTTLMMHCCSITLTTAAMVDNLIEKVECPLNRVVKYCLHKTRTASAVQSSEVSAINGCLST